jgi:hypothetical protein
MPEGHYFIACAVDHKHWALDLAVDHHEQCVCVCVCVLCVQQKLSVVIDIGSRVLLTGGSALHCDAESTPMNREGGDTSSTWLAS